MQTLTAGRAGLIGAFAMGMVSGMIAGPCIAAPLAGLLLFVAVSGDWAFGFFNMFAVWMFGLQVERALGSKRFLLFYTVCVIGAGITQLIVQQAGQARYAEAWAGVFVGAAIGILLYLIAVTVERLAMPWATAVREERG